MNQEALEEELVKMALNLDGSLATAGGLISGFALGVRLAIESRSIARAMIEHWDYGDSLSRTTDAERAEFRSAVRVLCEAALS